MILHTNLILSVGQATKVSLFSFIHHILFFFLTISLFFALLLILSMWPCDFFYYFANNYNIWHTWFLKVSLLMNDMSLVFIIIFFFSRVVYFLLNAPKFRIRKICNRILVFLGLNYIKQGNAILLSTAL